MMQHVVRAGDGPAGRVDSDNNSLDILIFPDMIDLPFHEARAVGDDAGNRDDGNLVASQFRAGMVAFLKIPSPVEKY
jgi:hypothetical protein